MKRMRTWLIAALVLTMGLLFSGMSVTYATETPSDGWVQEGSDWYYYEDGTMLTDTLKFIDGYTYGFGYDGAMLVNDRLWIYDEDASESFCYRFDEQGHMVTGWYNEPSDWDPEYFYTYYYDEKGREAYGITEIDGETYLFLDNLQKYRTYSENNTLYYFGEDGTLEESTALKEGWNKFRENWYYMENGVLITHQLKKIGNYTYGFDYDGWMMADNRLDLWDDNTQSYNAYFFDSDGHLTIGWYKRYSDWYYSDKNGRLLKGLQVINGSTYYFYDWYEMSTDYVLLDNKTLYYFGDDGKLAEKTALKDGWNSLGGKWFYAEKGSLVKSDWRTIGGYKYYFNSYGEMLQDTDLYFNDDRFLFDKSGHMVTGWYELYGDWYYCDKNGHPVTGLQVISGKTYYFADNGWMRTYETYRDDKNAYYFGKDGWAVEKVTFKAGWNQFRGDWFYQENGVLLREQWKTIGSSKYYFDYSACMVSGRRYIGDDCYRFDDSGRMITGWYYTYYGYTYYYDQDGREVHGIREINGNTYYFSDEMQTDCYNADSKYIYYFGKDGKALEKKPIQNGWIKVKDAWFYGKDGALVTGEMCQIGGKYYYFNYTGRMVTDDERHCDGNYRYFGSDGVLQTGWVKLDGGYKYFTSDGRVTGLQTINGKQYYFHYWNDGYMACNESITIDGVVYIADVNGVLTKKTASGWISGTYYIENGKMCTGWKQIGGKWYYFDSDGEAVKYRVTTIDDKRYFFNGDGVMQTGWIEKNNTRMYAQSNGVLATGWAKINGDWYYFYTDGELETGLQWIDGTWYNLDATTGRLLQTLKNAKNTWVKNDGKWYYLDADGDRAWGATTISGKQYYFDPDMVTNDWHGGCYYGSDGVLVKNQWINDGTYYRYADATGNLACDEWKKIGNVWYYFNDYTMVTGDQIIDGKLYTFRSNGAWTGTSSALTGWKLIDGHYFYYENGKAVTGMKTIGGTKYYFYSYGEMCYYTVVNYGGSRYFAQKSGAIATKSGWYRYYDTYVYVGKDGKLVDGLQTIGNKTYYFKNGVMITDSRLSKDCKTLYVVASNGVITLKPASSVKGWVKAGDDWYYSDGKTFYTGYNVINGKPYFFFEGGQMAADEYVYGSESVADASGVLHSDGWIGRYYLSNKVCFEGPCQMNGKYYYFNYGKSLDGLFNLAGTWYYYDGKGSRTKVTLKNGINNIHGGLLYYNGGASVDSGMIKINGSYYYSYSNGILATGAIMGYHYDSASIWKYAGDDGKLVQGWKLIDGYWYFFDDHYNSVTGIQTINGKQYVFGTDGRMIP